MAGAPGPPEVAAPSANTETGASAADNIAFALVPLGAHDRAGGLSNINGAVGRIVVVDIDRRRRERGAERAEHLGGGRFLVVARQEHRNAMLVQATGLAFG